MISISYTPNEWEKGDVLTADQLNANEKALKIFKQILNNC